MHSQLTSSVTFGVSRQWQSLFSIWRGRQRQKLSTNHELRTLWRQTKWMRHCALFQPFKFKINNVRDNTKISVGRKIKLIYKVFNGITKIIHNFSLCLLLWITKIPFTKKFVYHNQCVMQFILKIYQLHMFFTNNTFEAIHHVAFTLS